MCSESTYVNLFYMNKYFLRQNIFYCSFLLYRTISKNGYEYYRCFLLIYLLRDVTYKVQ